MSILKRCDSPQVGKRAFEECQSQSTMHNNNLHSLISIGKKGRKSRDNSQFSNMKSSLKMKSSQGRINYNSPHSQISNMKENSNDGDSTFDEDKFLENELKEYNYKCYSQINN